MFTRASPRRPEHIVRRGILTYVLGLTLIAAFSVAFHFVADKIVRRQQDVASVVNLSGRQRMLSQRIAKLAIERAAHAGFRSDQQTNQVLHASIAEMEAMHHTLLYGSPDQNLTGPSSAAVRDVYLQPPWNLDARMTSFLIHAHAVADRPSAQLNLKDPDLFALQLDAQTALLDALNAAVTANQQSSERSVATLRTLLTSLNVLMLTLLVLEALLLFRPLFQQLAAVQTELLKAGRTDPLTGSLNRRAFTQEAQLALDTARAEGKSLSVLMLDIDHFKSVNDLYGHPFGDHVINTVVASILKTIRSYDLLCRMGGEEFAIMLPGEGLRSAAYVAERVHSAIQSTVILTEGPGHPRLPITISLGCATLQPEDATLFDTLARADTALYAAKTNGRNRVETEPILTTPGDADVLPFRRHSRP